MNRERKRSQPMPIRIEQNIAERLSDFCKKPGQSKTTAIERAIVAYINNYDIMIEQFDKINYK